MNTNYIDNKDKFLGQSDLNVEELDINDVPLKIQTVAIDDELVVTAVDVASDAATTTPLPLPLLILNKNPHYLLHDFKQFINESKSSIQLQFWEIHDKYSPQQLKSIEEQFLEFYKSEQVSNFLDKYEKPLNNLFIGLTIIIILQIFKFFFNQFTKKPSKTIIPKEALTEKATKDALAGFKDYNLETIPICIGKGDEEELQLLNSYTEILQNSNDEEILTKYGYNINDLINSSELNGLNSSNDNSNLSDMFESTPLDIDEAPLDQSIDSNLNSNSNSSTGNSSNQNSSSNSPPVKSEDSFEKHENLLDDEFSLRLINNSINLDSKSSKSSILEKFSTSPSKKLVYKKSTAILTNNAFPKESVADTTVGDITTETVYSEPFTSDAETSFKNSL
ncbi:hypothetical protein BN7_6 [Wickerhamomyces ciferrii]|uniref:Uncharacterized protein n=1 Tax=Wickerhamomyces ciferrii (strain ATCC 14091 / BCRC 22168 / CBS 111 / JCM 3599 / NBRC 0793 / NRRL Y-1031 F-60-10) TaxID=1206466 RepID=K0KH15_WICCF|nr:uncharacterized protein BN7_6 [Wickerhamomyces ciferrii]CCH40473.1 hypothetical protein BN7_6 [Wickerhamomyces ciferrii]